MDSSSLPVVWLVCCVCGDGLWGRQWWNRDEGFGVCDSCSDRVLKMLGSADVLSCYGHEGVHYKVPTPV